MNPGPEPSAAPETSTTNVTGLTFGSEAKRTRLAVARAARAAMSESSVAALARTP